MAASGESMNIVLGMINTKLDKIDGKLDTVIDAQADHETRIVRLEDANERLDDSKKTWVDDIKWIVTTVIATAAVIIAFWALIK